MQRLVREAPAGLATGASAESSPGSAGESSPAGQSPGWPKALIAPHAGYVYSGPIAGSAYRQLEAARGHISRVVLIGPAHRVAVDGLATSAARAFDTPLGEVPLDAAGVAAVLKLPFVHVLDQAHASEHSLEVHLPFLQELLGDFALVPLVFGAATPAQVAAALEVLWGGPETLIVVSSDLSHYQDYGTAREMDRQTARAIESLAGDAITEQQACGRVAIQGLLETAVRHGLRARTLDLRNSGDTAGPRDQVVGYGAWALSPAQPGAPSDVGEGATGRSSSGDPCSCNRQHGSTKTPARGTPIGRDDREGEEACSIVQQGPLPDGRGSSDASEAPDHPALDAEQGAILLKVAADSIAYGLSHGMALPVDPAAYPPLLRQPRATFVTLHLGGELRGCIGVLEAYRPLVADVSANAYAAAFHDPRFPPVTAEQAPGLALHISILSAPEPLTFSSQADLLRQLRPGLDGLILEEPGSAPGRHGRRGTFLPAVWQALPDPAAFLAHLKLKAGLPADYWSDSILIWRYSAQAVPAEEG